jgi:LPS O-antigen subunit length determinant protein (WzzB/FepE family)
MAQNLTQPSPYEDEIDLLETTKMLIKSKKLIISTILIFTIASIIYSLSQKPSFETSAILEIGYVEQNNGDRKLIESPSDLISDLNILLLKNQDGKFSQGISMNSFEEKLINLKTTSNSGEKNENILNEIINYIDERHSNLKASITNLIKNEISLDLESVKSKIDFIKEKQIAENQLMRTNIEDRIVLLNTELPIIELEINQLETVIIDDTNNLSLLKRNEDILTERASSSPTLEQIIFSYKSKINDLNAKKYTNILETKSLNNQLKNLENVTLQSDELFSLEQRRKALESQLQMLMTQTEVKTQSIGSIKIRTIKPKTQLTILLGLVIGFITGIFLVFIRNFVRSYKESEA